MKKLTAILLCALMVISCFNTAVYAETTEEFTVTQEFCDIVANYLKANTAENIFHDILEEYAYFTPENINSHNLIKIYKATEEAMIFQLKTYCPPGTTPEHREYDKIGDYTFCANYRFTNDNITGHCYYTNGTVYSIREAVEQNLVTLEELAVTIPETTPTPEMVALLNLFKENGHYGSSEIVWADKLGDVGDYELYYVDTNPYVEAGTKIKVGYYTFNTRIDYMHIRLYLKKGETIYYLPDAYNDGLITDEDMDTIYDVIYNEENKDRNYSWTVTKIEQSKEEQLLTQYHKDQEINVFGPENDLYKFRILGEVQGYKLCEFCCTYYQPWTWDYELGNYKVNCSIGRESLFLVNDDGVLELQEAADSGILTDIETTVNILEEKGFKVDTKDIIDAPVDPYVTIASDRIKSGEKVQLLTVENAEDKVITFTSKTPEIAKVNQKGIVTALQKGEAEFEIIVGEEKFTAKVEVTNNPKLEQKKVKVSKKGVVKVAIKGKVKGIKNVYTNTKIAKIKSKPNASVLKIKGLKKGRTTLEIKVNGVKTLKLKVVVK